MSTLTFLNGKCWNNRALSMEPRKKNLKVYSWSLSITELLVKNICSLILSKCWTNAFMLDAYFKDNLLALIRIHYALRIRKLIIYWKDYMRTLFSHMPFTERYQDRMKHFIQVMLILQHQIKMRQNWKLFQRQKGTLKTGYFCSVDFTTAHWCAQ